MDISRIVSRTGANGTEKSIAAIQLYYEHKINYPGSTVRLLCDLHEDCPAALKGKPTEKGQMWIFTNQIRTELSAAANFNIVVTDRTVVDTIAYTYCLGFHELSSAMLSLAEQHVGLYTEIRFRSIAGYGRWLEPNKRMPAQGSRSADDVRFQAQVEETLKDLYKQLKDDGFITGYIDYA